MASTPATPIAPRVLVRLMGDVSLVVEGMDRSARLSYEKVRVLLAVLALAQSQSVSRAKLARMIWPDVDLAEGRARVRHALHTLKQVFSDVPEALEVSSTHIRLTTDCVQVDVLSLVADSSTPFHVDDVQRMDWYRPPLLGVLTTTLSEECDNWLRGWVARIELEMTQCRQRIVDKHQQSDDLASALTYATRWVEKWPEDESCHRMLIRLLVTTGQHDAATLAFEHCSRILSERLGMQPSAETRALLGVESVTARHVQPRPQLYRREFQPVAVVAVSLSWQSSLRDHELAFDAVTLASNTIFAVIEKSGAWIRASDAGSNTLLAYFGYPHLRESPVHYAVELSKMLSDVSLPEGVQMGIGLHSDVMLTDPERQSPDASGLMSQEALPLSWSARHRETLLSQSALQRLDPSQVLTLRRAGRTDHVLEHRPHAEVTPRLHGRAREFDFLVGVWMRQQPGRIPAMVTVTGFSGIGKSLLVNSIAEYAVQSGGQRIVVVCDEAYAQTPLYPVLNWLKEQYKGLVSRLPDVSREEGVGRLCDLLGLKRTDADPLEGLLSSTRIPESQLPLAQEILEAILARCSLNAQQPRLILVENIHWSDPDTINLLKKITEKPTRIPLMLLATSRAPVDDDSQRVLPLGPLDEVHMAQLVAHRSRTRKLTKKQRQHVLGHCHGVPLYALLLMRQTTYDLPLEYSCTLTDTLSVALHHLSPAALELAQLCALTGEYLDAGSLASMLSMSDELVADAIPVLIERGFLVRNEVGSVGCPILVQLAIKRMIPRKRRQRLHTLIVRHLISADKSARMIAPHAEEADEPSTPIWWQRAAIEELRESASKRARANLDRALKHAHRIDTSEARRKFEFECQVLLGELTVITTGPGSEQTRLAYETLNRLSSSDDPQAALFTLWGKWLAFQNTGRYTEALDMARRHMRLAVELDSNLAKGWAHYALGQTYLWCGQLAEAEYELDLCITVLAKADSESDLISIYGQQAQALVYATKALCMALRGRADSALSLSQTAMQQAMIGGAPAIIVACLLLTARIHYLQNSVGVAAFMCQGMLPHVPSDGTFGPWHSILQVLASLPQIFDGSCARSLQLLCDMLPAIEEALPTLQNSWLCMMARGLIAHGSLDEAAVMLNRAEDINRQQSSANVEPEVHCLRGDLYHALEQPQQARKAWDFARASAQRHGVLVYVNWVDARLNPSGRAADSLSYASP